MRVDPRATTSPAAAMSAFIASDSAGQQDFLRGLSGRDLIGFDEGLAALASVVKAKAAGPTAEPVKAAIDAARRSVAAAWDIKINSATPEQVDDARKAIEGRTARGNRLAVEFLTRAEAPNAAPVPPAYSGIRFAPRNFRRGGMDAAPPGLQGFGCFDPAFRPRFSGGMAGLGFTERREYYQPAQLAGLGSWFSEIFNKGKEIVKDVTPVIADVAKAAAPIIGIATGNPAAAAIAAAGIANSQLPTTVVSQAPNAVVAPPNPIAATETINPSANTLETILGVLKVLWGGNAQVNAQPPVIIPPSYMQPAPAPAPAAAPAIDPKLLIGFGALALVVLMNKR